MKGLAIIEAEELDGLKKSIENLEQLVIKMADKVKQSDPLMDSIEVQQYLKKGSTWVDNNKHKIGCSKVGGEWRFRKSVVDAYVQSTFHKDR
ncbi:helix-turn-helix domain-containing protein [Pedobacter sp. HDW13]|uniref:helix-turn-helix domain-containing protein n=1 Tax=Pedobacter sp. HDW13 TaxID=2714940 RepID=UPI00140BA973|nr:helix-turn-helix domain-containing protein [Pedobacter sp. HDW13]QIL40992.1 helix-turn-helix domain-containing protein [Pedobacter sp. HDW13]